MRLILITGFLGAGKTTFLKNLIPIFSDKRMALVINEFGKTGVDGELLKSLDVQMAEINNGSIFCSCRLDMFEEVLVNLQNMAPEMIIVEASGLSDPTNIRKILDENKSFEDIEYMGAICIADAKNFLKVNSTAKVCPKQIAVSDLILINKCDLVDTQKLEELETKLRELHPGVDICRVSFGKIGTDLGEKLREISPMNTRADMAPNIKDITMKKICITIKSGFTEYTLRKFVEIFAPQSYRVKGFVELDGEIYLLDCVSSMIKISRYDGQVDLDRLQKIVILSGQGLSVKSAVKDAVKWYGEFVENVE